MGETKENRKLEKVRSVRLWINLWDLFWAFLQPPEKLRSTIVSAGPSLQRCPSSAEGSVSPHTSGHLSSSEREDNGSPVSTATFITDRLISSTITNKNSNTRVLYFFSVDRASTLAWRLLLEGWCQPFMSSNIKLDRCYIYSLHT